MLKRGVDDKGKGTNITIIDTNFDLSIDPPKPMKLLMNSYSCILKVFHIAIFHSSM